MAYTPLKISVSEPCHEDWNGMHLVAGDTARHCDSCAKNVVDFTGFTDAQLHAYVRLNGEKMCGRFRLDQLERPLLAVSKPTSHPLKVAATAAGLMLAASGCGILEKSIEPVSEEFELIEFTAGLVMDPPRTGEISIEEAGQPTVCPPPTPSLDDPLMGKIRMPVASPAPKHINHSFGDNGKNIYGGAAIEDLEIVGEAVIEVPEEGDGAQVRGEVKEIAVSAPKPHAPVDVIPETVVVDLPKIHVIAYTVMGKADFHSPIATRLDLVKDTIGSILSPIHTALNNPVSHLRPYNIQTDEPAKDTAAADDPPKNEVLSYLKDMTVFPNPFVSELSFTVTLPSPQRLKAELISPNGRRVHFATFDGFAGTNTFVFEPKRRKLTHAAYHLRVTDAAGNMVTRTVVR